jgi:hypothetical protein
MRISIGQTKTQGSVLLMTLCMAWVIGIALVSYLTLVANQSRTTFHSQTWATCIPVLEAGIEEALTQLNYNNGECLSGAASHGWTVSANGVCTKTRILGRVSENTYVEVKIDPNAAATPIITAKGYAPAPGFTGKTMGGQTAFGMILGTVSPYAPAMVSRTVEVTTVLQNAGGGPGGLSAKGKISFSGGGSLDSFDSSDPNYSTGGQYDPTKRKANGKATTNATGSDSIHVDTAHIYGAVTTGPGSDTVTVTSGAVGDSAWNAGNSGIQSGHQTGDANLQFDAVSAPFVWGSGSTPIAGTVNGTNYNWVVDGAANSNWNLGSVNVSSGKSLIVTGGDVTLYVNGNFITGGSGFVYIAPGASLKLYVGGIVSVSGTGMVNGAGYASKNAIYGLSTSTQNWTYNGSSAFIGTVYAPNANFTFSGSAGAFGSFSANTVNISGGAHIAYDESLNGGVNPQYIVSSWNEI